MQKAFAFKQNLRKKTYNTFSKSVKCKFFQFLGYHDGHSSRFFLSVLGKTTKIQNIKQSLLTFLQRM